MTDDSLVTYLPRSHSCEQQQCLDILTKIEGEEEEQDMDKELRTDTLMAMGILEQILTATVPTGHAHYLEVQLLHQKATMVHQ